MRTCLRRTHLRFRSFPYGLFPSDARRVPGLIKKNHTYCGLLIVVLRTIVHPVNQDIKHEAITEQTNCE